MNVKSYFWWMSFGNIRTRCRIAAELRCENKNITKKRLREYDEACDIRKNLNDRNLSRDHVPTLYGLCREIILKENDKLCEETFYRTHAKCDYITDTRGAKRRIYQCSVVKHQHTHNRNLRTDTDTTIGSYTIFE